MSGRLHSIVVRFGLFRDGLLRGFPEGLHSIVVRFGQEYPRLGVGSSTRLHSIVVRFGRANLPDLCIARKVYIP